MYIYIYIDMYHDFHILQIQTYTHIQNICQERKRAGLGGGVEGRDAVGSVQLREQRDQPARYLTRCLRTLVRAVLHQV